MAYGREQYGQQPYGGTGFGGTGPALVSTSPANGDRNVPLDAQVSFVLTSAGGFDPWLLTCHLDNRPTIVGGAFQAGFTGTIVYSGDLCTVTITTHPTFVDSSYVSLQIWATDLSAVQSEFIVDFHDVFLASGTEVVTESESVALLHANLQALSENPSISEGVGLLHAALAGISETVATVEQSTGVYGAQAALPESVAESETLDAAQAKQLPLAEAVTESESAQAFAGVPIALSDTPAVVSDSVQTLVDARPNLSESAPVTEALGLHGAAQLSLDDSVASVEDLTALRNTSVQVAESTGVLEGQTVSAGHLAGLSESALVVEHPNTAYGAMVDLAQAISVAEDIQTIVRIILNEAVHFHEHVWIHKTSEVEWSDALPVVEALAESVGSPREGIETVALSENSTVRWGVNPKLHEYVPFEDSLTVGMEGINPSDRTLRVRFHENIRIDGLLDMDNYSIQSLGQGVPVYVEGLAPLATVRQTGTAAFMSTGQQLVLNDATVLPAVGDYLRLSSDLYDERFVRIVQVISPITVTVDRQFDLYSSFNWELSHLEGVTITTSKTTDDCAYRLNIDGLLDSNGMSVPFSQEFTAVATSPELQSVQQGTVAEGSSDTLLLTFTDTMRLDAALLSPTEYRVSGPMRVVVRRVEALSPTQVLLHVTGLGPGLYTLQVNATGTPKDIAGNPISPEFNEAIFTGSLPVTLRSVFTDRGPISKPPSILFQGTSAGVVSLTDVTVPSTAIGPEVVGKRILLSGGTQSAGEYRIRSIVATPLPGQTRLRLSACFSLPDVDSLGWMIFDPRDGQIADDPADVTVRVNSIPVVPEAVVGLLGQVVLPSAPDPTATVDIDYSWVPDPTVEVRRLNSREFRLNSWERDVGGVAAHVYRFNNVLITPSSYVADDMQAGLAAPEERDIKYRAFERAYTAALNQPDLLLLNSPHHKVAYPPLSRVLVPSFITYEANALPENDPEPWVRKGSGSAAVSLGNLLIQPDPRQVFWTRTLDMDFDHVFALSWRFSLSVPTMPSTGVFTGTVAGYSNEDRAFVVGCLITTVGSETVRKIGILRKGHGEDPSAESAWIGGIASGDIPTNAPAVHDWSVLTSYRVFRDKGGVVHVQVDGDVVDLLRVHESELPYLEELIAPFDTLEGVFFGTLSRPTLDSSSWDFVRYEIIPTNPEQIAPSVFVNYEGNDPPEDSVPPWTPVGAHGTESIEADEALVLDSTSASDDTSGLPSGLVGGRYRGFIRLEPLLGAAWTTLLDVLVAGRTWTHGVSKDAITAAFDDGTLVAQLCLLADVPSPKISYGGEVLPGDFSPYYWLTMGDAPAVMVGRSLRISDGDLTGGRIYYVHDSVDETLPGRVLPPNADYILEFRCTVRSSTADPNGFAGVTMDAYDGLRSVGLMLYQQSGVTGVALHSDGQLRPGGIFDFNWLDGQPHTYRVRKSYSGDTVSVFADNQYLGSIAYSLFLQPVWSPSGTVSFGSSTASSTAALSEVDWHYANTWRLVEGLRHYVGLWKGFDAGSLTGYHLPIKADGVQATVSGTSLGDSTAHFTTTVSVGDLLLIDGGPNKGVYEIAATPSDDVLTVLGAFPQPSDNEHYRVILQTDWTEAHRYRVIRDSVGQVAVYLDEESDPFITAGYSQLELPPSSTAVFQTLSGGVASVAFGAFDPSNLSQSIWDHVRYGVTRSVTEMRIAPHHEILNQWNVIASPEHLRSSIVHEHTGFLSCSVGIPPQGENDFLRNPAVRAYTVLNDRTPPVPLTQNYDTRHLTYSLVPVSALNRIDDVLNSDADFTLNDSRSHIEIVVPDDVLYNSLELIETPTGVPDLLAPADDDPPGLGAFRYQQRHCLRYEADSLPDFDSQAPTPWRLVSDLPTQVNTLAAAGVLTYGVSSLGTRTTYRNETPLPDAPGLITEVTFRLRLSNDGSFGAGDSGVRFGLSAPGFTLGLGFVTIPSGSRMVEIFDLAGESKAEGKDAIVTPTGVLFDSVAQFRTANVHVGDWVVVDEGPHKGVYPIILVMDQFRVRITGLSSVTGLAYRIPLYPMGKVVGAIPFDYLDGGFHTYRLVKDIARASVQVYIDG